MSITGHTTVCGSSRMTASKGCNHITFTSQWLSRNTRTSPGEVKGENERVLPHTMTIPIKKLFSALPARFRERILWPKVFSGMYIVMERLQTTCTTPTSCQATQETPPFPATARANAFRCSDIASCGVISLEVSTLYIPASASSTALSPVTTKLWQLP